jgi:hypothetical protein
MILNKVYDKETKTQRVWYDSSMILYSEMVEDENENKGDLYVTFKNGSTYMYKDVSLEDYVLLIAGGTDASQGKTLNKIIKTKYEYFRKEDKSVENILNELKSLDDKKDISNVYFISGHRDLTDAEFEYYYIPMLMKIINENEDACFVIGDCKGCDIMAQNFLVDVAGFNPDKISVYCVNNNPEHINEKITNIVGSFTTHDEKDIAMTNASFKDIAFIRNWKELTGTAQNILRRNSFMPKIF